MCCGESTLLWELEVLVVLVFLDEFVLFTYGGDGGGDTDVLQVGARVKGCLLGKSGEIDGAVEDFVAKVDAEDRLSVFGDWKIDEEAARKATQDCIVEIEGSVACYHHEDAVVVHAVPFAEELVDDFAVGVAVAGATA